jgi:nucleotide-binding universal stress UspA family protein
VPPGFPNVKEYFMSNVIVTGVDGSETARAAALTAAKLALALHAELLVVCVFEKLDLEQVEVDGREYEFTTEESARELAAESIRALKAAYSGLRAEVVVVHGKPAAGLLEVAQRKEAELIVVGNRRVQGVGRILGSIATDIAHKAPCDVYIAYTHARS